MTDILTMSLGRTMLSVDDYVQLHLRQKRQRSNKKFRRCVRKIDRCPGRLPTSIDQQMLNLIRDNNHGTDPAYVEAVKIKNKIRVRAGDVQLVRISRIAINSNNLIIDIWTRNPQPYAMLTEPERYPFTVIYALQYHKRHVAPIAARINLY